MKLDHICFLKHQSKCITDFDLDCDIEHLDGEIACDPVETFECLTVELLQF